jgi:hypothetical protein
MQIQKAIKLLTLLFFVLYAPLLSAQTTGDIVASDDSVGNSYVGNLNRRFMVKTFTANRNLSFTIRSRTGQRKSLTYSPNGNYFVGFGFFYKKLGFEAGIKLPTSDRINERYGRTRYLDVQTNFYGTRYGGDLTYQRYRGFYPRDPLLVDSTWRPGNNYPYRNDITARNLAANAFYIFNHKRFSYKAAYTQTEKQLKSSGSFILMAAFSHLKFDGNSSLLPVSGNNTSGEQTTFQRGKFFNSTLLPGYAYTYVIDDFYFSAAVHLGVGTQFKNYTVNNSRQKEVSIARKNHIRVAGGYNTQRWMAGASVIIDNTPIRMQEVILSASNFNVKLFVGYRFDARSVDERIDRNVKRLKSKYKME